MDNKQTVLVFSGPARQVFRYLALLARHCGNVKLGDLLCRTERRATGSR